MDTSRHYVPLLFLLGAAFFLPFLGGVHLFDWDEINFAEISREMLVTGEYLRPSISYMPFWEKPPLFFWIQAASLSVFGIGEYAARLPNAVLGIFSLLVIYTIGKKVHDARFGFLWAGVYFGSVLPFLYCKSGIIDPLFNLLIFSGLFLFILGTWKRAEMQITRKNSAAGMLIVLSGLLIGLAMLAKGQAGYLIMVLTLFAYWVSRRLLMVISIGHFVLFSLVAVLVTASWYGVETLRNGPWFVTEFVRYQIRLFSTPDAGHGGFPGYHVVVLLIGVFPASVFAIRAFGRLPSAPELHQKDMIRWMKVLFWVVLILFSIVKSKIVHYSSLCYFPLTYLAAVVIMHLINGKLLMTRWMTVLLTSIGGLFVTATLALPFLGRRASVLAPLFNDPFARENLEAAVSWPPYTFLPGLFFILVLALFFRYRGKHWKTAFSILFGGTAVFVMLSLIAFIGRIEGYSQRAAIEFFEEVADKTDSYQTVYGYKSYAHLFYGKRHPARQPEVTFQNEHLLYGNIDKDVYIATKVQKADDLRDLPDIKELYAKNGFVFFLREKKKKHEE